MVTLDFDTEKAETENYHALPKSLIHSDGNFLFYERENQTGDIYARYKNQDYIITCPFFETGRNGDHRYCMGPTYNPGLAIHICSRGKHNECPTYKHKEE